MPLGKTHNRKARRQSSPWIGALCAVFLGCLFAAPSAFAVLPEVPQVDLPPPEVPKVTVPQLPPPPVQTPAPTTPEVKVPETVAPAPSTPAPTGSGNAPEVSSPGGGSLSGAGGTVGGVTHAVGGVTHTVGGVARPSADAVPREGSGARERPGATAIPSSGRNLEGHPSSSGGAPSVRVAVGAPVRRLLAYVWPAIALGPLGEALVIPLGLQLMSLDSPVLDRLASLARSLSLLPETIGSGSNLIPAPQPTRPGVSHHTPFSLAPDSGGMTLLATLATVVAALIGVVALARLTVGEDLFSTRWMH